MQQIKDFFIYLFVISLKVLLTVSLIYVCVVRNKFCSNTVVKFYNSTNELFKSCKNVYEQLHLFFPK